MSDLAGDGRGYRVRMRDGDPNTIRVTDASGNEVPVRRVRFEFAAGEPIALELEIVGGTEAIDVTVPAAASPGGRPLARARRTHGIGIFEGKLVVYRRGLNPSAVAEWPARHIPGAGDTLAVEQVREAIELCDMLNAEAG